MEQCEAVLNDLIAGMGVAEDLKEQMDTAEESLHDELGDLVFSAGPMAIACAIAAYTRSSLPAASCAVHTARTLNDLNEIGQALNQFIDRKQAFNEQVRQNHDRFNQFCYCLSLGAEAIEYGTEFDALEQQLEELLDELDEATSDAQVDAIEEEIGEVLDDVQFYDELLDELREELEMEFE